MKKAIGIVLAAVLMLAGCGGGASSQAPSSAPARPAPASTAPAKPTNLTITFSNASDYIFNEIYISPTASNDWGSDLLGSTSVLKSNGSLDVEVQAYDFDSYDILVVDEDKDEYYFSRVPMQDRCEVAIYFGDEGLAADVYDKSGTALATVAGSLGGSEGGGDSGGGGQAAPEPQQVEATGTGYDTNGQYTFTVYNESDYDIYAIHMGVANASAGSDIDILPQILPAHESIELKGMASQGDWLNTDWTLYITDVDGDSSASFDSFNPWTVSYVDVYWDSTAFGYTCDFVY